MADNKNALTQAHAFSIFKMRNDDPHISHGIARIAKKTNALIIPSNTDIKNRVLCLTT